MCHYFFDPSCRLDWEVTLEVTNTISQLADDTVISHQVRIQEDLTHCAKIVLPVLLHSPLDRLFPPYILSAHVISFL